MFTGREVGSCAFGFVTIISKYRCVPVCPDPNILVQQTCAECMSKSPLYLSRLQAEVCFVFSLIVFPAKQKRRRLVVFSKQQVILWLKANCIVCPWCCSSLALYKHHSRGFYTFQIPNNYFCWKSGEMWEIFFTKHTQNSILTSLAKICHQSFLWGWQMMPYLYSLCDSGLCLQKEYEDKSIKNKGK